jgi:hypothetical protein
MLTLSRLEIIRLWNLRAEVSVNNTMSTNKYKVDLIKRIGSVVSAEELAAIEIALNKINPNQLYYNLAARVIYQFQATQEELDYAESRDPMEDETGRGYRP